MISDIERCSNHQNDIDSCHKDICNVLYKEMDAFLLLKDTNKKIRKKFKYYKPYWNDHLSELWRNMRDKEKLFRLHKNNSRSLNYLYSDFKESQRVFDRELRKAERTYNRGLAIEIESVHTTNPREFWKYICSLGPRKEKTLPLKVYTGNNNTEITSDINAVLSTWKEAFSNLYNKPICVSDENEYIELCNKKVHLENQMGLEGYSENVYINEAISLDELEYVINKLKLHKAVGLDEIPNEVLRGT